MIEIIDETLYEYDKLSRKGSLKLWFIWKKVKVDLDFLDEQAILLLNDILVQLPNSLSDRRNYYEAVLSPVLKKHVPIVPTYPDPWNNLGEAKTINVLIRKRDIIAQLENTIRTKFSNDFLNEGKTPISKTNIDDSEESKSLLEIEDLAFIAQNIYKFLDGQISIPQFNQRQKLLLEETRLIISIFHELGYATLLAKSHERYLVTSNIAEDCTVNNLFTGLEPDTIRRYFNDLTSLTIRKKAKSNYEKVLKVVEFIRSNKGL